MGLDKLKVNAPVTPDLNWLLPAVYISVAVLIMLTGEAGREFLRYDRVWLGQGEAWRLISAHAAHLGWSHLALNSAALVLVWVLVGPANTMANWLLITLVTMLSIDIGFWFLNPELYWYVGMSGVLHGLLLAGIVSRWRNPDAETLVLLILLAAKIGWEQWNGPVPGSAATSGGPVIVDAHLYGALGGLLGAFLVQIRVKSPASI